MFPPAAAVEQGYAFSGEPPRILAYPWMGFEPKLLRDAIASSIPVALVVRESGVGLPAGAIAVFLTIGVVSVSVVHSTYDVVIVDAGGITNRELAEEGAED